MFTIAATVPPSHNIVDDETLTTTFCAIEELPTEVPAEFTFRAKPVRCGILYEGANLTNGDRDKQYGPPAVNMAASGALKATMRQHMVRDISVAELEALDMVMTKIGRMITGHDVKRDTYVDAATYLAIAGEIALAGGVK